jgi:hypothetical protein
MFVNFWKSVEFSDCCVFGSDLILGAFVQFVLVLERFKFFVNADNCSFTWFSVKWLISVSVIN